jgi:broad specificity phosphatase PhoE
MALFRPLAALAAIALAGCATVPDDLAKADFYVMRHLQKGDGADPGLTPEGHLYAQRLVDMLASRPPKAIYVSPTRRARESAALVAARWKLVPKDYDPGDTPGLVARVLAERGPVLIVGHSNTVPEIVEGLSGERPAALGDSDYDDIWFISRAKHQVSKYKIGNGDILSDAVP